jgi:hypothetical protein
MFSRNRRRPQTFFERTPDGREQIILERRHSYSGNRETGYSRDDNDEDRHFEQDRRILAENYALANENHRLRGDNQRLLRDNQALARQTRELRTEIDNLTGESQHRNEQEELIRDLQHRLARERRRSRDERTARETIERERTEREREVREELTRLRDSERRWRAAVAELTREVEGWLTVNRDKERRIRELEELMRRLRVGGLR